MLTELGQQVREFIRLIILASHLVISSCLSGGRGVGSEGGREGSCDIPILPVSKG